MTTREQVEKDFDDAAVQVKAAKQAGRDLHGVSENLYAALAELELSLRVLQSKRFISGNAQIMTDLGKLEERISRLRELRNIMELGSFSIQIDRTMETVWERLS